ncbi:MAG: pyridoxamine 5'-phosphate oxidase family protein [Gammaproteobacteria bacterium]|nr:pyridoxamine 5'-phosphate oxidase family protein [Gammaproteobacteria bacterium]
MSKHRDTTAAVLDEARGFVAGFRTLLMASASADGHPDASYAPYVRGGDAAFYVYVSELSRHTANLEATREASVLFIESEESSAEPFARRRATFDCRVEPVARDEARFETLLDEFGARFGETFDLIRPLPDFRLYGLHPQRGVYVRGFARAYRLEGDELARVLVATGGPAA